MNIDIFGYIGSAWDDDDTSTVSVKSIRKQLLNYKKGDELTVYINSPGGSVFEGLAIYNILAEHEPTVKIIGEASSIASVIACAGKKVLMAETSLMLFHKPWTMSWGNEDDLEKVQDQLKTLKESIVKAYQRKTNLSAEAIEDLLIEDKYHNAEKCKELGFADEVYTPGGEDDNAKAMASLQAFTKQARKFFNLRTNNNHFSKHSGAEASMNYEQEYLNLTKKHTVLESDFKNATQQLAEFKAKVEKLTPINAQLSDAVEALRKENEAKASAISDFQSREVVNEVNLVLAQLKDKIAPAENCKENDFALTKELLLLKKLEGDPNAMVGGKSLYQRKIDDIQNRKSLDGITKPINAQTQESKPDLTELDFNNTSDRQKIHELALAQASELKITYMEALENILMEAK